MRMAIVYHIIGFLVLGLSLVRAHLCAIPFTAGA